jgi:hypothetical protein
MRRRGGLGSPSWCFTQRRIRGRVTTSRWCEELVQEGTGLMVHGFDEIWHCCFEADAKGNYSRGRNFPWKRDFRVRFSASIPLVVPSKKAPFRNYRPTDQRETKAARCLHIETPSRCLETLPMVRDKNATLTLKSRVQGIRRPREYRAMNQ